MKFKLSKSINLMAIFFKISMYIMILIVPFSIFAFFTITKGLSYSGNSTYLIPIVLFFGIIIFLFILFPINVIKLIKNVEKNGFISFDEKKIKLFAITRILDVEWKDIEKIQLVTAPNGKKCIGISFATLKNLPKNTANFLDVMKSNSGYHLSYPQDNFEENIEDICSKLNSASEAPISSKKEDNI